MQRDLMKETAEWWSRDIMRRRLSAKAKNKYGHQKRTDWYLEFRKRKYAKGLGRSATNVFSGRARRSLLAFPRITGTHRHVKLKLDAPRYFVRPKIGAYIAKGGRRKIITQQPDKRAELERNNRADNNDAGRYMRRRMREEANRPGPHRYRIDIRRG